MWVPLIRAHTLRVRVRVKGIPYLTDLSSKDGNGSLPNTHTYIQYHVHKRPSIRTDLDVTGHCLLRRIRYPHGGARGFNVSLASNTHTHHEEEKHQSIKSPELG